jgi:hypothetical protein
MSFALSNIVIGSGSGTSIKDSGTALSSLGGMTFRSGLNGFSGNEIYTGLTTVIAHGLGKIPTYIKTDVYAKMSSPTFWNNSSGYYLNGTQICSGLTSSYALTGSGSYAIQVFSTYGGYNAQGSISVNSTNITITWTVSNNLNDVSFNILWCAA